MAEITVASYNQTVSPAFTGGTATLKIWYDRQFLTSDNEIVLAGDVENPNLTVACTVGGGGFTITIPQFLIDSTIDGVPPISRATAILFDENGIHRETVLNNFKIPNIPTSTTWPALFNYNQGSPVTLPDEYYTKNQINVLFNQVSVGAAQVTSVEYTSALNRISGNSAQMTSADNALSARIETVSNAVSVVSNAVSALSQTNSAEHAALSARITSVAGGAGSATSQELSVAAAGLSGRIDSVVNAVSVVSNAVSALSQTNSADHAALSTRTNSVANAVSALSQANSAEHATLSVRVTSVETHVNALSDTVSINRDEAITEVGGVSVRVNSVGNAISVLSNVVSALSQANSAAHVSLDSRATSLANALSAKTISSLIGVSIPAAGDGQVLMYNASAGQWLASGVPGGAGSVTSQELSTTAAGLSGRIDSAVNAVSIVSQALSALSQANSASHVSLDGRATSLANAISVVSNAVSVLSADVTSLKDRVSASSALTSNLQSAIQANSAQMISADNAISDAVSIVSAACASVQSILSTTRSSLSALSADVTSVKDRVSANSALISTVASALSARIDTVSNAISAKTISSLIGVSITGAADGQVMMYNLSDAKWHASTAPGGTGSVTSQELSIEAAALSERIDSVANAISVVSNARSVTDATLSTRIDSVANAISIVSNARSVTDATLSTRIDSVANAVSVLSVAVANTSNDRSVVSVYAQQVSNNASIVSNYASVVSNYASIVSATAAGMPQHAVRIVSNTQSNNTSVLAGISGLVLTLGAGETWAINGMVLVSTSAAGAGLKLGVSAGALSLPRFIRFDRVSTGQSAGLMGAAGFLQASGTSTFLSLANLGGVANGVMFDAIVNAASASNFELMFAGIASTAASPIHVMPGSYLLGYRLK